jgi:hypothetical protein
MPSIIASYKDVTEYFTKNSNNDIPESLEGIWNLSALNNMSILMSFNNAEFNENKRQLIVKLYKTGNWLFKQENLFTNWLCKTLKYSYQFDFNEDYTQAVININLGKVKIRLPKSIMYWTMELSDGKMIRTTKIFNSNHHYDAIKLSNPADMYSLRTYDYFYY